jgi:cell division septation protein DedD
MTDRPDNDANGIPVFTGGVAAGELDFSSGEGFWARLEELVPGTGPEAHLDEAMAGKPAPRTWLFLHPPGRGGMSAAAALSFARALASRGQSALVLDADETHSALTGWIGRTELEGWIDLARYGTSVLTSGVPLPFAGKRGYVLGVGSFTPTDVTGDEIKALMARLRRQADDILVVAPAHAAGQMWAQAAEVRILCWDPATLSRVENEQLATEFAAAGTPVTGVMAFGEIPPPGVDGPEDVIVEEVFAETEEPAPDHEGFPVEEAKEETPAPEAAAGTEAFDDVPDPVLVLDREDEPGRKSSGVFWFGAVAATIVIVAAFVYWYQVLRVPSGGHFENVPAVTQRTPVETRPASPVRDVGEAATAVDTTGAAAMSAVGDSVPADLGTEAAGSGTGTIMDPGDPGSGVAGAAADEPVDAGPETAATGDGAPTDGGPATDPVAEAGDVDPAVFDMAPYGTPVGTGGWALHVYSLPRMEALQDELKRLERRGFKTAVKAVDVEGKGRWYRVFLGNFASRAEADAAKPALMAELGVDYAAAKRFEPTPPE